MIKKTLKEISNNFLLLSESCENDIIKASNAIIKALENNNKIMFCGNGGSAADSQHLSAELIGRYKKNRKPLSSISLTTDTSALTAISNDFSFNDIFSRQVEALGNKGDVLYAISTSGNSENIIKAIHQATENGLITIGLTGKNNGKIENICDCIIRVPATSPDRIQEMHIAIGHIICEIIEDTLC